MDKMNRLLEIVRDQPRVFGVRLAAAIYRGNRLVSYGFNSAKSHPFQKKWARHPEAIYTHAEIDAIRNALKREEDIHRCTMYVARIVNDAPALANPCSGCWSAIKAFGIKQVIWTLAGSGTESYTR